MGANQARGSRVGVAVECVLVGAFVVVVASVWRQDYLLLDGAQMVSRYGEPGAAFPQWYHPGYFPVARLLDLLVSPGFRALQAASALGGGLAAALFGAWLAARGVERPVRLAVVALLLLAPAFWVHAGLVEVHTFQLLGAVVAGALATRLVGASERAVFPWVVVAIALPALLHRGNLVLAPAVGFAALAPAFVGGVTVRRLAARAVPAAVGLVVALVLFDLACRSSTEGQPGAESTVDYSIWLVRNFGRWPELAWWREDVLVTGLCLPGLLLLPLVTGTGPRRDLRAATVWVALGVSFVFYVGFREPTRGGYMLTCAPFAAWLLADAAQRAVERARRRRVAAALAALAAGGVALLATTLPPEFAASKAEYLARRVRAAEALVDELGAPLCLVSADPGRQPVSCQGLGVYEYELVDMLLVHLRRGGPHAGPAAGIAEDLLAREEVLGRVVLDWSWGAWEADLPGPYVDALEAVRAAFAARRPTREVEAGGLTFVVIGAEED